MNHQTILLVQIVFSIILIALIVLQSKGSGIGSTFGGESGMYRTKRGAERMLFYLTIVIATLFVIATLAGLIL